MILRGRNGTNIRTDFPKRVVRQLDYPFLAILVNVTAICGAAHAPAIKARDRDVWTLRSSQ